MSAEAQIKAPATPEDVQKAAQQCADQFKGHKLATSYFVPFITAAIMAERERCALVAEFYSETSLHAEWTDDARGAAYYACSDVANAIRNPTSPLPNPSADFGDDLPF